MSAICVSITHRNIQMLVQRYSREQERIDHLLQIECVHVCRRVIVDRTSNEFILSYTTHSRHEHS
jgi:hypothetical protein